ncbi:hypothetical protein ABK040_000916 [Willaertia magna]
MMEAAMYNFETMQQGEENVDIEEQQIVEEGEDATNSTNFTEFLSHSHYTGIHSFLLNTTMDLLLINNTIYRIPSMEKLFTLTFNNSIDEDIITKFSPDGNYLLITNKNNNFFEILPIDMTNNSLQNNILIYNNDKQVIQQNIYITLSEELNNFNLQNNLQNGNFEIVNVEWNSLQNFNKKKKNLFYLENLISYNSNFNDTGHHPNMLLHHQNQMSTESIFGSTLKLENLNNILIFYLKNNLLNNYSVLCYLNGKLPFLQLSTTNDFTKNFTKFILKDSEIELLEKYEKNLQILNILENVKNVTKDIDKFWKKYFTINIDVFKKLEKINLFKLFAKRSNFLNLEIFTKFSDTHYTKLQNNFLQLIDKLDNLFYLLFNYIENIIQILNIEDLTHYNKLQNIYQTWKMEICENIKIILQHLIEIQSQKSNIFLNLKQNFKFFSFDNFLQEMLNFESFLFNNFFTITLQPITHNNNYNNSHNNNNCNNNVTINYCNNCNDYTYEMTINNELKIYKNYNFLYSIEGLIDDKILEFYKLKEEEDNFILKSLHSIVLIKNGNIVKYICYENEEILKFTISIERNLFGYILNNNNKQFYIYEI